MLSFTFRKRQVLVTHGANVSDEDAAKALSSSIFTNWVRRCEKVSGDKRLEVHGVEIQSVDMFGARGVGFVKIKADCTLVDGATHHEARLPGICFLRGNAVTILVALHTEDGQVYSLLVDQPRVPVGNVSVLELPAGMLDDESQSITGIAVAEMREECGIEVHAHELVDLTQLAYGHDTAIAPSPGGCDETCRFLYLEKRVTNSELTAMRDRLQGLRDHGEFITLRVVEYDELWTVADAKALIACHLVEQLRKAGKLAPTGALTTALARREPMLELSNGAKIPQLAFGLYLVPPGEEGEQVVLDAVAAGYRHFDTATFYDNEATLGRALRRTGLPREAFFITSKVWNDAVKGGRAAVRASVEKSLVDLDFGGYFDLFLVHWPVPGYYIDAYKELEDLHHEGKLKSIGVSNFSIEEYEALETSGMSVSPVCNQMEVSPVLYRPDLVDYFQSKKIAVAAYKPLSRASAFDREPLPTISAKHGVTPAQVMLRWSLQKGLIVVAKTSNKERMLTNRDLLGFALDDQDISALDALTSEEDREKRRTHEKMRKESL